MHTKNTHQRDPMSKASIKNEALFYLVTLENAGALDTNIKCGLKNNTVWLTVYSNKY